MAIKWRVTETLLTRAKTVDENTRSVEVVATTDAPVPMHLDFASGQLIDEILVMGGVKLPKNKQMPLIDSHDRWSVKNVLGSFKDIRTEDNTRLVGRVYFSETPAAEEAYQKLKEGHLTDFSVGYNVLKYEDVDKGKEYTSGVKTYKGPCRVVTAWEIKELSICPIGADPEAKARGKNEGKKMGVELRMSDDELRLLKKLAAKAEEEEEAKKKAKADDEADEEKAEDEESEDEFKKKGKKSKSEDEEPEDEFKKKGKKSKSDSEDDETKEDEEPDEEKEEDDEPEEKGKKSKRSAESLVLRERLRVAEIDKLCGRFGISDTKRQAYIARGVSADSVRKAVLNNFNDCNSSGSRVQFEVFNDENEDFRKRAIDALKIRAGMKDPSKAKPGALQYAGCTLSDIAKKCLQNRGLSVPWNTSDLVGRALTTSDLPLLLLETSRQSLIEGFQEADETYSQWTGEMSVIDFKESRLLDVDIDNDLHSLKEYEEYQYTKMQEAAELVRVETYGRAFVISRQSIINDELGVLTTVPAKMGAGVKNKISDTVYGLFNGSGPTMGDGKSLFHADHKNISALGANGNPTVDKISAAMELLKLQTNLMGRRLNIQPMAYLLPVKLYAAAETFFKSDKLDVASGSDVANIYFNSLYRVYEPRLDDINSNTFYLLGPKNMGVRIVYLAGNKTPYFESRDEFKIDGLSHKVRFDFGVKAVSWRAMVKATTA
jgi:HK97 family phage prohead protease